MQREQFPTRTIVLMILTLVAFGWFWVQMHRAGEVHPVVHQPIGVQIITGGDS